MPALLMGQRFDYGQAVAEADRCLLCHDPPCSRGCPAGTDPGTFIRKFRLRNITGAIRTIKSNNILGGACGILCPTSRLCEKGCVATGIERPIQIGKLQRFLVEYGYDTGFKVFSKPARKPQKVAIIGSGPAGLACAAELAKSGYQATIFEKMPEPGGVMRYGVPLHRFAPDFLMREIQDIIDLGVTITCNTAIEGNGEAEELLKKGYQAVFLAPGLWGHSPLMEHAGEIKGVFGSLEFLKALREKRNAGLAPFFKNKKVAVIGGGSVAIDCAESALEFSPRDVYLIYRRSYAEMPSEEAEIIDALRSGIHFILLTRPVDYVLSSGGALEKIRLMRTELGAVDASGRRAPVDVPGSEWLMEVDTVIEAIGQKADSGSPRWYPSVKTDKRNLVAVKEETGETSAAGIFAGGDIVRGPALIVEAVSDGKKAAGAIIDYLSREVSQ